MPPSPDPKIPAPPLPGAPPSSPATVAANIQMSLEDKSKYIRTMAKDMAKLSGTPAPAPAPVRPQETDKKTETFEGVSLAKEEQPFFERVLSRAEKEADVPVELPSFKEASDIVNREAPMALNAAADAERTAILNRLREKVSLSAAQEVPVPQPVPPPPPAPKPVPVPPPPRPEPTPVLPPQPKPEWANIPAPAPAFAPLEETAPAPRMPQTAKESYREPVENAAPQRPIAPKGPEGLHTYSGDFAKRIDTKGSSTFSVLAAEQDARKPAKVAQKGKGPAKALLTIGTGVVLLLLAGGGIFATYQFVTTMRNTPVAGIAVPTIVFADEYRKLEGSGIVLLEALAASANGALLPGNVLVTYIIAEGTDGAGSLISSPAHGGKLIEALRLAAPDILLRNIAEESTVGVINAGTQTRPFFALRVDSYERTYAGMLTWEPLMARDLALLYPLYPAERAAAPETASTTASSTPIFDTPRQATALTRFVDAVVANHDVRILRDSDGKTLMLYGYADKRTLLIVRDENAFEALLARLKSE